MLKKIHIPSPTAYLAATSETMASGEKPIVRTLVWFSNQFLITNASNLIEFELYKS